MPNDDIFQVETTYGPVTGLVADDGTARFLGIPYAAAPTGVNRFAAPAPPEVWHDPLPAHTFGPTAPRPTDSALDELLSGKDPVPGEGWLNLNVWTQARGPAVRRPVLVWIHGGAFVRGSSAGTAYDGAVFARNGIVCVSINYRLGVEGFGYIADAPAPANRGLLDQIFALEWVRDNIANFGGDPDRITVAGESAGAMSILALLSTGRRDLFHRAIVQSGSAHVAQTPEDAALVVGAIAADLRVEASFAGLSTVSPARIVDAQTRVHDDIVATADPAKYGDSTIQTCGMSLVPVIDGALLHRRPIDTIARGAGADIPLLIGTNIEENRHFVPLASTEVPPAAWQQRLTDYGVPDSATMYERYQAGSAKPYPRDTSPDVFAAVMTDRLFRIPCHRIAEARANAPAASAATHVYEFGWRTPKTRGEGPPLGACHIAEIPFVWQSLDASGVDELVVAPPRDLADEMHRRWVEFILTGALTEWPAYDTTHRPVMTFHRDNEPPNEIVLDPRGYERSLWDGSLDPEQAIP
ncbi:carboxylesterase/lipase family protein [Embleya scabrispora]|uniref:carboxylesterase/lipase family protein n=1 Tax=Embleya scabrispora TaxID=159449 RepID=UPI00037BD952|nr:carboxylesterase family protein [Embleya scabrispora]MYS79104.1 carboxylesterase family protein [Streptomyces sp. SID5474]